MEIGIDAGGTKCEGIVLHNGKIKDHLLISRPSTKAVIFDMINSLSNENPGVTFIGIGFPAPVRNGQVEEVNNIDGWNKVNIAKLITKKFNIKCKVENDASCFTLSEAKPGKTTVGITLGTGIGCGIAIGTKLYRGNGAAGEISRIPYNNKTIEDFTSGKFFRQQGWDPESAYRATNNEKAKKMQEEFSIHLGKMLATIILAYDPDRVIFSGSISKSFPQFAKPMLAEARKYIYKQQKAIQVLASKKRYSACIGAVKLKNA